MTLINIQFMACGPLTSLCDDIRKRTNTHSPNVMKCVCGKKYRQRFADVHTRFVHYLFVDIEYVLVNLDFFTLNTCLSCQCPRPYVYLYLYIACFKCLFNDYISKYVLILRIYIIYARKMKKELSCQRDVTSIRPIWRKKILFRSIFRCWIRSEVFSLWFCALLPTQAIGISENVLHKLHALALIVAFSWLHHTKPQLRFTIAHVQFDWTSNFRGSD